MYVKLPYLLHVPSNYKEDPSRRWPLLLYLHGGSVRGSEIEKVRTLGLPKRLDHDPQFPFIVVSPLAPEGEIWTDVEALAGLVDFVQLTHRVDPGAVTSPATAWAAAAPFTWLISIRSGSRASSR